MLCWKAVLIGALWAQDTLFLTLAEAEKIFLQRNLLLFAQRLQIEAEKALVWQARLWPNPHLSIDQADLFTKAEAPLPPFLSHPRINQISITLSQLLFTARKRLKGIALAEAAVILQEAAFAELLRQLRYTFHQAFFGLQRDQALLALLRGQLELLQQLSQRYKELSELNLVPLPEYLRIESLRLQVQSDLRDVRERWETEQHELRQLLRTENPYQIFWISTDPLDSVGFAEIEPLEKLLALAKRRGDVQLAAARLHFQEQALSLEQALAYPDLTLNATYDRLGGYRFPQWGIGVGLPLPLFHRNQGRIQAATYALQAAQVQYEQTKLTAESEILQAWRKATILREQWSQTPFELVEKYQGTEAAYRENLFLGRTTLLAYVDFFQSYRSLSARFIELAYLVRLVRSELRYMVGWAE
ncbi:MAG: TolC family protein [Bacteroidia bacterium]|nr:TolC family protein [Bacteroidia bacterium]MDW8235625.1 TolC family protein [Bacteroidia bacterium]